MDRVDLRDGELELTAPTTADIPAIASACQDRQIARKTTLPYPYTTEDAADFVNELVPQAWAQDRGAIWAIRRDGQLAGMIGLEPQGPGVSEIGFWAVPAHRGQGLVSRAVGLVVDHGFAAGLQRISWRAVVGNWGSWRAVWRHGFRLEGVQRGAMVDHSQPSEPLRDAWIGGLLATDPRVPHGDWGGPENGLPARPDAARPMDLVRQFHDVYDVPVRTGGADVDVPSLAMRMSLIAEEFAELVGAVYGADAEALATRGFTDAVARDDGTKDTVAAADALADLVYVVYGMALETGIPLEQVLAEVQRSNLSKLDDDGSVLRRADGKILKGPQYCAPDIAAVLAEQLAG
ncbi:MAG: GNAT family N-acetyltransferase [Beutenbergiaceae bacterium]